MLDLQPDAAIKVLIEAFKTINLKPIATNIQKESGIKEENQPMENLIPGKPCQLYHIFFFTHLLRDLFYSIQEALSLYNNWCNFFGS